MPAQRKRSAKKKAAARSKPKFAPPKLKRLPYPGIGCRDRAAWIIWWIEEYCYTPEGVFVGRPIILRDWQRNDIRRIYNNKHGTRRAILSFGRKNAKTTLAAMLLLVHLCGPEAIPNSQLYSAAQSRDQAALLFNLAAKIVRLNPLLDAMRGGCVHIRETNKQLVAHNGVRYSALSADASTNLGLSPVFIVHDELGQVQGPRSPLYEALETATGAQGNPLSIIISTQAPTDADLLSVLIDDAKSGKDKKVVLSLYTADENLDPFSDKAIKQACPAFGDFMNADEVRAMAQDAKRMPSREAEYRNLILNQRVERVSPFVTASVWADNAADPRKLGAVYCGLDLSSTSDLTAFVMVSYRNKQYDVVPTFWLPEEGLAERARQDVVPYDVWADEGFLETTPGRSVEYEYVAGEIARAFQTYDVRKVAFDRYNMKHLRPWLIKAGLSEELVDSRFVEFGQGFVSMGPAVRALEGILRNGNIRHGGHPVLQMCARNAVVKMDEAGNQKLDKKKSRGRIDGMVALAMAVSVAGEILHEQKVFKVPLEQILEGARA